jgi:replicative DNA helicase
MSGKSLPHNGEAEISILASILIDKEAFIDVVGIISSDSFYDQKHRKIFSAMLSLYERSEPIDLVTLTAQLKKDGNLKEAGSKEYLATLMESIATAGNIGHYAHILSELASKRRLIALSSEVSEKAYEETTDVKQLLDKTESELYMMSQKQMKTNFVPIKDALADSFDRIDELHQKGDGLRGIPTGFSSIDAKLAGLQASNMVVLAARPGQGKTAFCLNVAQYLTVVKKIPIGFFSLEMSKEELVDRLLIAQSDIEAWRMKTGKLTDEDLTKLSEGMGTLTDAPLYVDDTPAISILEMRTKARRLQHEHKAQLFIVDYIQLIDSGRKYDNRVQEVSYVSQAVKNLARELKVPIIAVSQLSRAVEHRGEKRPQLADLRESGAIEQDADVVCFLYRPQDEEIGVSNQQIVKFLIAKHRNGPLAEIDLLFRGDRMRFFETEKRLSE